MIWFYLLSGLFLGWSLGANDTANIFGTAVGTRMLKFRTAAIVTGVFLIIGAVVSGAGTTHTLSQLGAVNELAGSFTVALAAAVTITIMTKVKLPVSTSQGIVGAIIGWNLFTGSITHISSLSKIFLTWVMSPILGALIAFSLYKIVKNVTRISRIHLLDLDQFTRLSLLVIGAFGAYSLGANNIANVMGVFVDSCPFNNLNIGDFMTLTSAQQLFLLGGLAVAVGVFTYSKKVMLTVGNDLFRLSPMTALIVVLAHSIVLFLFASQGLSYWLSGHGLPSFPLVPVSSSQAVIGGIIGIALAKGGRGIKYRLLGKISSGWILTPVIAGVFSFVSLFFVQNVFQRPVYRPVTYKIDNFVLENLEENNIVFVIPEDMKDREFENAVSFKTALEGITGSTAEERQNIIELSEVSSFLIDSEKAGENLTTNLFSEDQIDAVHSLHGRKFIHKTDLQNELGKFTEEWKFKEDIRVNSKYNDELEVRYRIIWNLFRIDPEN
ncbi:inorganic phosphate transporter [candidate division KSB1 bacterium]